MFHSFIHYSSDSSQSYRHLNPSIQCSCRNKSCRVQVRVVFATRNTESVFLRDDKIPTEVLPGRVGSCGVCKAAETVIYGRPLPGTRTSPDLHEIAFNGLVGGPTVSGKAPRSVCVVCPVSVPDDMPGYRLGHRSHDTRFSRRQHDVAAYV